MKVKYWLAWQLKDIAKGNRVAAHEELLRLASMIQAMKGSELESETTICECGALLPPSWIENHRLTHLEGCNEK